jgi:Domain of unknown function (DUF4167)
MVRRREDGVNGREQRHPPRVRNQRHPLPHTSVQRALRNYERYLALAHAEAAADNPVGAANYYQHAEHYFRSMRGNIEED